MKPLASLLTQTLSKNLWAKPAGAASNGAAARAFIGIALALLLSLTTVQLHAQLSSASVNGTVKDASGAVIPGATISLRATATGVTRVAVSNGVGAYAFVAVNPGSYTLEVTKDGFSTARQAAATLVVNQTATFDFTLAVGTQVQNVEVNAAAAQLETSESNLGTVFNPVAVNDLPLNGRNFTQLLTLAPGAGRVSTSQSLNTILVGSFDFPAVNGQWNRSNLFLMDGINDEQPFSSQYAVPPIVDSIQEFKMQSHNDQTQFGGVLGGIVNVVTKSGTNAFHEEVWEFLRNDAFDANNPLLTHVTPLKQSVYGATAGGPVILPHYTGRNRTFFYGAYEGTIINSSNQSLYSVPTTAELNGDFSGISAKLYNPFTTTPDPAKPGSFLRTPFTNNNISQYLDPKMVQLAKAILPAPIVTSTSQNGLDSQPNLTRQYNYSLRLDHQINQSNLIWARFNQMHATVNAGAGFTGLESNAVSNAQNTTVSYVHTFGTTATIQLQAGHNWQRYHTISTFTSAPPLVAAGGGFNTNFTCNYIGPLPCQVPILAITGYLSGGSNYGDTTGANIYEYKADFTKLLGRHMIQAGADISPNTNSVLQTNPNLGFSSFQTSNLESSANTGDAMASFLLGVPNTAQRRNLLKILGGGLVGGFYFQDQWKMTSKLTVNAALRYDLVIQEGLEASPTLSNMSGSYNLRTGTFIITKDAAKAPSCSVSPASPCIPNGTLPANVTVANSNKLINNDYDNIQPRLGIAYQFAPDWVLHLSAGRVYDTWSSMTQAVQNEGALWPSVGLQQANNLNSTTVTRSAEDPLALGTQSTVLPAATPFGQVAYFVAPYLRNPYSDQWLVGIEHPFGSSTLWKLNYVGSLTHRLPCCDYFNVALTPGPGTPVQARAPFSYITPTHYEQSNGSSNYNALQVQLQRQATSGFSYMLNYTWSKVIDVACDGAFGSEGCFVRNPYNPKLDRSVAGFDLPQMFTGTILYQLPFGTGQRFQLSSRGINTIVGGWQLNTIATVTSGSTFTVSYSGDRANTGNNYQGADLIGNPNLSNRSRNQWFNTAAFQTPAQYTYGTAGRNILRTQQYTDVDVSVFRTFSVERAKIEFRAEAFNALNHPVLGTPQATLNSATFGQVLSMASTQRELQFALKIHF